MPGTLHSHITGDWAHALAGEEEEEEEKK